MVDFLDIFLNLLMTLFYWHFARVAYSFYLDLSGQPAQGQSPGEPPQGNVRVRGGFFLVFCCCCLCVGGCVCVCVRARACVFLVPPCLWVLQWPRVHAHGASMRGEGWGWGACGSVGC
jgi:hypothetical protein